MRILGIDPGIERTGWGIISKEKGSFVALDFGCITTRRDELPGIRLMRLYHDLIDIIEENNPQEASMEQLFFNTNAKTAFVVGQARGVAMLAVASRNLPLSHYTPLEVKQAVAGYGRADKRQVEIMVKSLLALDTIPRPDDISDALAVALTHAVTKKFG